MPKTDNFFRQIVVHKIINKVTQRLLNGAGKSKFSKLKCLKLFSNIWSFEIVSNFEFRASKLPLSLADFLHPLTKCFFKTDLVLVGRACQKDLSFGAFWKLNPDPLMGEKEGDDKA